MFFKYRFQSAKELFNSLKEFRFVAVASFYGFESALDIFFAVVMLILLCEWNENQQTR